MSSPSLFTLEAAFPGSGAEIRGLISGTMTPDDYTSVIEWERQCYHRPRKHERVMCALNEVLGGYGVEAVFRDGELRPEVEYINMGDTYCTTLLYDEDENFIVGSWGDYVEDHGL